MESVGSIGWKAFNTLASAAGIAMGATALGVKANASHFRRNGCNNEYWGSYSDGCNGYNQSFYGFPVSRFELGQNLAIANLQAKDYSNQSDLGLFADYTTRMKNETEHVNGRFETIFTELVASRERMQAEICRLDKEAALNKQAAEYNFYIQNSRIDGLTARVNNITKEVVPIDAICPEPLVGCTKITANPQILTTTAATTTGTVVNGTVDVK